MKRFGNPVYINVLKPLPYQSGCGTTAYQAIQHGTATWSGYGVRLMFLRGVR